MINLFTWFSSSWKLLWHFTFVKYNFEEAESDTLGHFLHILIKTHDKLKCCFYRFIVFLFLKYYDLPDLLVYMGFIIHHRCWLPMAGINFRVMMCLSDPNGDFQESQLTFLFVFSQYTWRRNFNYHLPLWHSSLILTCDTYAHIYSACTAEEHQLNEPLESYSSSFLLYKLTK